MEEPNEMEDDNTFPNEEITAKMDEAADEILKEAMWDEHKVPVWINQITEKVMFGLVSMQRPYKYVVTVVMQ